MGTLVSSSFHWPSQTQVGFQNGRLFRLPALFMQGTPADIASNETFLISSSRGQISWATLGAGFRCFVNEEKSVGSFPNEPIPSFGAQ